MLFADPLFVGIDPTSGRNTFTYAALDKELNLIALADGEIDDLEMFLKAQKSVIVAVNAPAGVNTGLVRRKMKQAMPAPHQIRGAEMRLAEFELREHGIVVSGTPASAAVCAAWVQLGFELYRRLGAIGFMKYPRTDSAYQLMETHPHACFCVLAEKAPLAKPSLEGRMQRQLILIEQGLRIQDPMEFFEEITRYKLARGIWPMELLYLPEQLDALVAAFTAWLTAHHSDRILVLGDVSEGAIILPAAGLKAGY